MLGVDWLAIKQNSEGGTIFYTAVHTMISKWVCQLQATTSTLLPIQLLLRIKMKFYLLLSVTLHLFIPRDRLDESTTCKIQREDDVYIIQTIWVTERMKNWYQMAGYLISNQSNDVKFKWEEIKEDDICSSA